MITHNELYNELQEEYLKNRDNNILGKMYKIIQKIAYNYLKKYEKRKGISLRKDELSHDAAVFVIEQYLKKSDFLIQKISAYTYFGVIKVLYMDKEREINEVSYEAFYEKKYKKDTESDYYEE
jgi:hypothetical protein